MKLREIEKGMIIHCKTQGQAQELSRHSDLPSYFVDRLWDKYKSETCYYRENCSWSYCDKDYFVRNNYEVIEFEDLIIDDHVPTKPVFDDYIICELISGETLNFGGMCNNVTSCPFEAGLLTFRINSNHHSKPLILASVPINNIKCIKYIHSREAINEILEEINSKKKDMEE